MVRVSSPRKSVAPPKAPPPRRVSSGRSRQSVAPPTTTPKPKPKIAPRKSVAPPKRFQGSVRPGTDVQKFRATGRVITRDKKFGETKPKITSEVKAILKNIPTQQVKETRTDVEGLKQEFEQRVTGGPGKFLETAEVSLFPGTVGPKFLSSSLGAELTSGQISESQREKAEVIKELLPKTAGFGPEATKSSLELLRLMRERDKEIKNDLIKAEQVGERFETINKKFEEITNDFNDEKISATTANNRQEKIIKNLKQSGFRIDNKNGEVNISHPVYDRLQGFTGSAWANLLKQARKGDSSIKDQSLIASLDFLDKAFKAEKIVLGFQLAGGLGAGKLLPKVSGSAKSKSVLNVVRNLAGASVLTSFSALSGAQTFVETGEPLLAFSSAGGTASGFLLANNSNKLLKKIEEKLSKFEPIKGKKGSVTTRTKKVKQKQQQVQKKKKEAKKKLDITREQAINTFRRLSRSEQVSIIERALKGKLITPQELREAKTFMKRTGLKDFQVDDRLSEAIRRVEIFNLRLAKQLGTIDELAFKQRIKFLKDSKQKLVSILKQNTIKAQTKVIPGEQIQIIEQTPKIGSIQRLSQSQRQQQIIKQKIKSATTQLSKPNQSQFQKSLLQSRIKSLQASLSAVSSAVTQDSRTAQDFGVTQTSKLATKQISQLKTKLKSVSLLGRPSTLRPPSRLIKRPPSNKIIKIPLPFSSVKVRKKKLTKPSKKSQGYNAFAKSKGVFKKLNRVPISKSKALNLSSFIVDNSVSATGKVLRANKPSQKPKTRIPGGHFKRNVKSYRFFKKVGGKKVPLINSFIEKRKARINTFGEKKGLSVARALAKLRKGGKKKKK